MTEILAKTAVSPIRRRFDDAPRRRASTMSSSRSNRTSRCIACVRTSSPRPLGPLSTSFAGSTLYAVKCNPEPRVLRALWTGGVRHFDCASPAEIALVRQMFPEAAIHYMHPVKSRAAIREAASRYGVSDFVLDSEFGAGEDPGRDANAGSAPISACSCAWRSRTAALTT